MGIVFRNTFGYGNAARRIMIKGYIGTLYWHASMVWYPVLKYKSVVDSIRSAQRRANMFCARSFKDVSYATSASTVLAVMPPFATEIERRSIRHSVKKGYLPQEWYVLDPIEIGAKDSLKMVDEKLKDRSAAHGKGYMKKGHKITADAENSYQSSGFHANSLIDRTNFFSGVYCYNWSTFAKHVRYVEQSRAQWIT